MKTLLSIVAIGFGIAVLGASELQVQKPGDEAEKTTGKTPSDMSSIVPNETPEKMPNKMPNIMNGDELGKIIAKIDEESTRDGNSVSFKVKDRDVYLVFDENADRMRIMTPIAQVGIVPDEIYKRMLQANYDAVLDPRYAIANDLIWAVFIHPLSTLTEEDFVSSIVQTVTAAATFGSSYSSGAFVYGGGDSNTLHEELLKELEEAIGQKGKGI